MHRNLDVFKSYLKAKLGKHSKLAIVHGELVLVLLQDTLLERLEFLKHDPECLFVQLMDACGVDYPGREPRFDVVYQLLSVKHNRRLRIIVPVGEHEIIPSVSSIYESAGWWEREVFDMFGVKFSGHPDLRRILTDYGFEGHPLRKDFPLMGYTEVRYSDKEGRVVSEPVKLPQAYREFNFESPWQGMQPLMADEPVEPKE
jgi:NADH-quinone oxidoreductase subunit C